MMNFKDYVSDTLPKRKYIALQYNQETQERLRVWCYENGFDLSKKFDGTEQTPSEFDFHTTVFFSTSKHVIPNGMQSTFIVVVPDYLEYLGENKDIPVLKVQSNSLLELRREYEVQYGMHDEWPDYKPHISLSYNRDQKPDFTKIKLPKFPLVADMIKIKDAKIF